MSRCAVCGGLVFGMDKVEFYDVTRDKVLYRHKECPQEKYQTKKMREALIAKRKDKEIPEKEEWKVI